MTCDDDMLMPSELIESRYRDFVNHDCKSVITTNGNISKGFSNMSIVSGNSFFSKKMLDGYADFFTSDIINTYHDDRFYQSMFYLNGY